MAALDANPKQGFVKHIPFSTIFPPTTSFLLCPRYLVFSRHFPFYASPHRVPKTTTATLQVVLLEQLCVNYSGNVLAAYKSPPFAPLTLTFPSTPRPTVCCVCCARMCVCVACVCVGMEAMLTGDRRARRRLRQSKTG